MNSGSPEHEAEMSISSTDSSQHDELQYEGQSKATQEKHKATKKLL